MAGAGSKGRHHTVAYGRTPLGQLIYDLGFAKLKDATIARKHGMPLAEVRRQRAAVLRGLKQGKAQAKRQGR